MQSAASGKRGSLQTSGAALHLLNHAPGERHAALTSHSSYLTAPQCSFAEPAIRCTLKILARPGVGRADFASVRFLEPKVCFTRIQTQSNQRPA